MRVKKLTPVMVVDVIEPCLDFWKRLGFATVAEVPHGDVLGFVMLGTDGAEVMYQTKASVAADVSDLAGAPYAEHTPLFIEVDDVAAVRTALTGYELIVVERRTFYGATETIVRGPAGQVVTFAQFAASGADAGGEGGS
jgi:hypothetical protein